MKEANICFVITYLCICQTRKSPLTYVEDKRCSFSLESYCIFNEVQVLQTQPNCVYVCGHHSVITYRLCRLAGVGVCVRH